MAGGRGARVCLPPKLRVYLLVQDLQRQFAAHLGAPSRVRGHPPFEGSHALIVEVTPDLAVERVIDRVLAAVSSVGPGILFVERRLGVLEVHGAELAAVVAAGRVILDGLGATSSDRLRPQILHSDVVEGATDRHTKIVNRDRRASTVLPGEALLVHEVTPALFAAVAANEAERVAPANTLVDVQMTGMAGRVCISGEAAGVHLAHGKIIEVLAGMEGRER